MRLMGMSVIQILELDYYIANGKRPDGSMVTDKWVEQQLVDCLAEIRALGEQLQNLEAITFNIAGLEYTAKRIVRSWKKGVDLAPLVEDLRDNLKLCNPKASSKTPPK
jgi:hypothetical protein